MSNTWLNANSVHIHPAALQAVKELLREHRPVSLPALQIHIRDCQSPRCKLMQAVTQINLGYMQEYCLHAGE